MGTVGNVFELFDVCLTEGTVAPPFEVPDYASELAAVSAVLGSRPYYIVDLLVRPLDSLMPTTMVPLSGDMR